MLMEPLNTALEDQDTLALEKAFQEDPAAFRLWFEQARVQQPENVLLKAWHARLFFDEIEKQHEVHKPVKNLLLYTVLISTITWAVAKIPAFITVDEGWFYPRFIPFLVIGALIAYFSINGAFNKRLIIQSMGGLLLLFVILMILPDKNSADSLIMALIHMPLVLISFLGFVFAGGQWRDVQARLHFIRYGGELIIFTALVLLGGGVLTALTLGLFSLIDIPLEEWYMNYVLVWGLMSAPLIATWVWDQVMKRESQLASVIANVFSPLFLVLTVGYLLALIGEQRSPFSDREFLIIFNVLLLVVWAITVFSVTGRGEEPSKLLDITNLSLVFVTLIIDAIALSAIAYRIVEMGITPNRMAVSGANLLIFIHLLWIFFEYVKELRGSRNTDVIKQTIARFLPVYTGWSLIVVVLLPVLFGFE